MNKGCHSHQRLQPPLKESWWALRELRKGKNTCHPAALRLQPLPAVSPAETQDVKIQDTGPRELRCLSKEGFNEPRLLHLPIHRKVLNSLTWDIWFSLINSHLLMFPTDYLSFVAKLLYNLASPLYLLGAVSQSYLKRSLQGCSPHFASNKT